MILIYVLFFFLLSFLLIRNAFFKRQKIVSKIIIYLFFLILWFLMTLLVFVYIWNTSPDYSQQKQMMNSWNIQILNNSNQPIENALIIETKEPRDTIISNIEGYVNFYKLSSNSSVIIQAKGYISDTIFINELESNSIHLLVSIKK